MTWYCSVHKSMNFSPNWHPHASRSRFFAFLVFSSTTPQPARFTGIWGLEYLDMVVPLPQSKRQAIKQRLDENTPHISIAEEMSVSIQTVKNYSTNLKQHNVVLLPSVSWRGRPPRMTREMVDVSFPKAQFERFLLWLLIMFLGLEGLYWEITTCISWRNGWFHWRGVWYRCFRHYNQQNPPEGEDMTQKGTFHPSRYSTLLLILATKNRTRTVSITSRWVVYSPYRLDIRTTDVYRWKCFQWEGPWSQIWMGPSRRTSTPNREL